MIQKFFKLNPIQCNYDYEALKENCSKDFLEYTSTINVASQNLYYDYLTPTGKKELDFMLMYMH